MFAGGQAGIGIRASAKFCRSVGELWFPTTMGLLEEAIREHFDLRRRHGADPDAVAREELDALAPSELGPRSDEWGTSADAPAQNESREEAPGRLPPLGDRRDPTTGGDLEIRARRSPLRETSFTEETAEIDMRTVLGKLEEAISSEEADGGARVRQAVRAERTAAVAAGESYAAFDFELDEHPRAWETPGPRVRRVVRRDDEQAARGGWAPGGPGA